jgi:hypothetical protein
MTTYTDVLRGLVFDGNKEAAVSLLRSKEIPKNSLHPLKGLPHAPATTLPATVAQEPHLRENGGSNMGLYIALGLVVAGGVYLATRNSDRK